MLLGIRSKTSTADQATGIAAYTNSLNNLAQMSNLPLLHTYSLKFDCLHDTFLGSRLRGGNYGARLNAMAILLSKNVT